MATRCLDCRADEGLPPLPTHGSATKMWGDPRPEGEKR
jgi:hypothetical protein